MTTLKLFLHREVTQLWSTHRKWGITLIALAGTAVNENLLHGSALHWVQVTIAALGALGVRAIPNADPIPSEPVVAVSTGDPSSNVTVVAPEVSVPAAEGDG